MARLRLEAQGIARPWAVTAVETVRRLGAVQAQDYLGSLWAVGLRTQGATEASVEAALAERSLVRTWPLRGTLHLVAAEDVRWLRALLAERTLAGARGRLTALGIDSRSVAAAERAVTRALSGGRRLTRPALYGALQRARVSTEGQRGIHLLWCLAHRGVLCFGPREGKQHTFALLEDWVPDARGPAGDEALGELARRYFVGHGPATARDFAWWAGLTGAMAKRAIELAGKKLGSAEVEGATHWFDAAAAAPRARGTWLLPGFDEFIVAFADRRASVRPEDVQRVNPGAAGILNPTVVSDGQVVGTWKRTLGKTQVRVAPSLFPGARKSPSLRRAARRYAEFLKLALRD